MLRSWLRKLSPGFAHDSVRQATRHGGSVRINRYCLEQLEERLTPVGAISIINAVSGTGTLDANLLADGAIVFVDPDAGGNTLSSGALAAVAATTNIVVQATTSITFDDIGTLNLLTGAGNSATFSTNTTGSGAITFNNTANTLTTAGGAIVFDAGTALVLANLNANGGSANLNSGRQLPGNLTTQSIQAGNIALDANGDLIVADSAAATDLNAGTGSITLQAGSAGVDRLLDIQANAIVAGTGGITLIADNISIGVGSSVNAGAGSATLRPFESGTLIDLGGADAANTLGLTDAELDRVTAGELIVGSAASGNVSVTAVIQTLNTEQMVVVTGGTITDTGAGQIIETRLGLNAATGIGTVGNPLDILCLNLVANGGTGGIFIAATAAPITVGGVSGSLSGLTASGGNIVLTNTNSLTFSEAVSNTGGGNITLTTTGGSMTLNAAVTATGGLVALTASTAITQTAGTLTATSLVVRAGGTVTFLAGNDVGTLAANMTGVGSGLTYADANALTIGTVDSVVGITTNGGAITLTAGGTNNALTVNSAITTGGVNISLNADNMGLNAAINVGIGDVFLQSNTVGQAIDLGGADAAGTLGLTSSELNQITSDWVLIGLFNSGNITLSAAIAPSGSSALGLFTGGTISGPGTITETNLLLQAVGAVTLTGNNDVDVLAATVSGSGNSFSFTDINTLTVGSLSTGAGATGVTTSNGIITLTANDLIILNAINAGTARVILQPFSAGQAIDLGTNTASQLGLTDTELDLVTAGILQIGNATAGAITVSAAITPGATNTLMLHSNAGVSGSGTLAVANLRISTGLAVTLTGNNDVDTLAAAVGSAGQAFTFTDVDTLDIGAVDTLFGITLNNGNATLMADEIDVNQVFSAGTGIVTLLPFTAGRAIRLGDDQATSLSLPDTDLDRITASIVRIGSAAITGSISITAPISGTTYSTLSLRTGGGISQSIGSTITVAHLAIQSATSVSFLEANDVQTNTLAANLTAAGQGFTFFDLSSQTVGTVDGLVGITTNGGPITLTAGGVNSVLTVLSAITSNGGLITLTADNMVLSAPVQAGTGNVILQPMTAGQALDLGGADAAGTLGLTNAEFNQITAGRLTVGNAGSGTITVSAAIAPAGTAFLTLLNSGSISGSGSLTETNLRISSAGSVTLSGSNDVDTLAIHLTGAGNGFTFADLDDLTIGMVDGVTGLTTNNGAVVLLADTLDIQQNIQVGTAPATLRSFTAGRQISLGAKTTGYFSLTDAELDRITAAVLGIGEATAGAITFSGEITPANVATLALASASTVSGTGSIIVANLRITAGGSVTLTGANDITTLAAVVSGAGQAIQFMDVNSFTVGTVDGVSGLTTNGGTISLTSGIGGTITLTNAIASGNAAVTLTADDLALNAAVNSGSQVVTIQTVSPDRTIDLGSNATNTLGLTDGELDQITASTLQIGSSTSTGTINLTAALTATTVSVLSLRTLGAITDGSVGEQTDLSVTHLAILAGNGIGAGNDLNLSVTTLAFTNASGAVAISNDRALTLGTVDSQSTSMNTGTTTTLTAAGGLTFAVNITSAGTLTATSTETTGAADGLTINGGVTIQSTTGNVVLQAGDLIDLRAGAAIQANAGSITLETGFGDNDGSGAVTLSGTLTAASTPAALGGIGVDTFTINTVSVSGLTLDGRQGSDLYLITLGAIAGPVTINDSGTAENDQAQLNATAGGETFTITPTQLTVGTFILSYNPALEQLTVNAGGGDDAATVTPSANMAIVLDGGERRLVNVLNFHGAGQSVTVAGNSFTAAGLQPVTFSNFMMTHVANAAGTLQFPGGLNANQRFVQSLYYHYLGRLGATAELNSWTDLLGTLTPSAIANGIARSTEAVTRVIESLYIQFLDRLPDAAGQAHWVGQMQTPGVTMEQVIAGFVASGEFATRADAMFPTASTNESYVRALYRTLLGRTPSDSEVASWISQLPTAGRFSTAMIFLGSTEFRTASVQSFYGVATFPTQPYWRSLLHRTFATSTSEISSWVTSGLDLYSIESQFASSAEAFPAS